MGYIITDIGQRPNKRGGECGYPGATMVFVHCTLSTVNRIWRVGGQFAKGVWLHKLTKLLPGGALL